MAPSFDSEDRSVVEFQLGNKQLLLLFIGLLVICAIFFFIGLRVGEDTARGGARILVSDAKPADELPETNLGGSEEAVDVKPSTEGTGAADKAERDQRAKEKTGGDAQAEKSSQKGEVTEKPAETKKPGSEPQDNVAAGWYVQVLANRNQTKARELGDTLSKYFPALVEQAPVNGVIYHRVLVGPYPSKAEAEKAKGSLVSRFREYKDAYVRKR